MAGNTTDHEEEMKVATRKSQASQSDPVRVNSRYSQGKLQQAVKGKREIMAASPARSKK